MPELDKRGSMALTDDEKARYLLIDHAAYVMGRGAIEQHGISHLLMLAGFIEGGLQGLGTVGAALTNMSESLTPQVDDYGDPEGDPSGDLSEFNLGAVLKDRDGDCYVRCQSGWRSVIQGDDGSFLALGAIYSSGELQVNKPLSVAGTLGQVFNVAYESFAKQGGVEKE